MVLKRMALICCAMLALSGSSVASGRSVVVLPFDLIDDSHEGEIDGIRADQTARLRHIAEQLRAAIRRDGRYVLIDDAPLAADVEKASPIYKCNGCEDELARKVGAELAIVGNVQKVSNLILNINVYVRDVANEKILRVFSQDLRGNTDESWAHAMRYLIRHRLLPEEQPK